MVLILKRRKWRENISYINKNDSNNNYLQRFFKAEPRRPDAYLNSAFVTPGFFREMVTPLAQQHKNINSKSPIFNPYPLEIKLKGLEIRYEVARQPFL